jgi:hypothetical protein
MEPDGRSHGEDTAASIAAVVSGEPAVTDDAGTWAVAVLEVIAAAGLAAYWATWLRQDHDEPDWPAGYVDHEKPFLYADAAIIGLLVVGAVLQVFEEPAGTSIGLVTGGMLLFLGIIDWAYLARTHMFDRAHHGVINAGIVASVLLLAAILIVRFF